MKETVEIVRCENCCYWDECWNPTVCFDDTTYHYCDILDRPTKSDFFCADGLEINNQEDELEVFNKDDMV